MCKKRWFTDRERQQYHFLLSRKGTSILDEKTGKAFELSDFQRGVHLGMALEIKKRRRRVMEKKESNGD